jgi:hypothetical protein
MFDGNWRYLEALSLVDHRYQPVFQVISAFAITLVAMASRQSSFW